MDKSDIGRNSTNVPKGGEFTRKLAEQAQASEKSVTPPGSGVSRTEAILTSFANNYGGFMTDDGILGTKAEFQLNPPPPDKSNALQRRPPKIPCDTTAQHLQQFGQIVRRSGGSDRSSIRSRDTPSRISRPIELAQKGEKCRIVNDFFEAYDKYGPNATVKQWQDCESIVTFFEEFRKFELGQIQGPPAADFYHKFTSAYKDFKERCSDKPEWNLPEPVRASDLYDFRPPTTDLWRARFTIQNLTPQELEGVLETCVQDLKGHGCKEFRFSGYYIYNEGKPLVYQFNNGLGEPPPDPKTCEQARSTLRYRLEEKARSKQSGPIIIHDASTNDLYPSGQNPAEYPPENPKAKFQVPFGKTRGYTALMEQTFETIAIHYELGLDKNKRKFTMIDAHILAIGGKYPPYKEAVGLILGEHPEDIKKVCRAGVVLGQAFLVFELFEERMALPAKKKKQQQTGEQRTASSKE